MRRYAVWPCAHTLDPGTSDQRACEQDELDLLHRDVEPGCPLPGNHHAYVPPPGRGS